MNEWQCTDIEVPANHIDATITENEMQYTTCVICFSDGIPINISNKVYFSK